MAISWIYPVKDVVRSLIQRKHFSLVKKILMFCTTNEKGLSSGSHFVGCHSEETDISNFTALHKSVLLYRFVVSTLTLLNGVGKEAHALILGLTKLRCRLFQRCAGRRKMGMWQNCRLNRNYRLALRSSYCILLPFISGGNASSGISAAPLPVYNHHLLHHHHQ